MTSILLLVAMVVMFAGGFYLLLDRSLTKILLGFLLAGNATNLMIFLMSGSFGAAPIVGSDASDTATMSDPLPQAFILTAIVITFGITAFVLALTYRSWLFDRVHDDAVLTDEEDQDLSITADELPIEEVLDSDIESTLESEADTDNDTDAEDDSKTDSGSAANLDSTLGSGSLREQNERETL